MASRNSSTVADRLDLLELNVGIKVVDDAGDVLVPHTIIDVADDAEAERLSLSLNAHRRMLKAADRLALVRAIKAAPEKSNRALAEIVGWSDKTVAAVRREQETTAEIPQLEKTVGKDGRARKQPAKKAEAKPKLRPADHAGTKVQNAIAAAWDRADSAARLLFIQSHRQQIEWEMRRSDVLARDGAVKAAADRAEARAQQGRAAAKVADEAADGLGIPPFLDRRVQPS